MREWHINRQDLIYDLRQENRQLKEQNNKLLDVINNQDVKIADLEKKNAELREKYLQATDEGTSFAHLKSLERKNAELKRDKEDLIFIRNQTAKCMCEDKDQLTKAKEIIKSLMHTPTGCIQYYDLYKKAERFLEEIEK